MQGEQVTYPKEAQKGVSKQPGFEPTVASQESLMTKASVGGTSSRALRSGPSGFLPQASKREALPQISLRKRSNPPKVCGSGVTCEDQRLKPRTQAVRTRARSWRVSCFGVVSTRVTKLIPSTSRCRVHSFGPQKQ